MPYNPIKSEWHSELVAKTEYNAIFETSPDIKLYTVLGPNNGMVLFLGFEAK